MLQAAEARDAALLGLNEGTLVAMLLAADHPALCRSLVLFTPTVKHELAGRMPMEAIDAAIEEITRSEAAGESGVEILAASRREDERFAHHLSRLQRFSVRPGAIGHYFRQSMEADVARPR